MATSHGLDPRRVAELFHPYFVNMPWEELLIAVTSSLLPIFLHEKYKKWRAAREPHPWDPGNQEDLLGFLRGAVKGQSATEKLEMAMKGCSEGSPQFMIYEGFKLHLEGQPGFGALKLLQFHKSHKPTSKELREYLVLRTAKAMAGAGALNEADEVYEVLAGTQERLERAETIREQCNLATQIAWTWPKNQDLHQKLNKLLGKLEWALKSPVDPGLHGDEPTEAQRRRAMVEASLHEFSRALALLKTPAHKWRESDLQEVKNAIQEVMDADPTTGRNRHTHLATLYLRSLKPDLALQCLSAVRDGLGSKMERGLSCLVEGQALQQSKADSEQQLAAFKTAEQLFEGIAGDRYRRVARAFSTTADPRATRLKRIGSWAANMAFGNRIIGSFVVTLPSPLP